MVAVLYLLLAVLRLGFLCSLLSRPIISAFLTSGAMIISSSQVTLSTDSPVLMRRSVHCVRTREEAI